MFYREVVEPVADFSWVHDKDNNLVNLDFIRKVYVVPNRSQTKSEFTHKVVAESVIFDARQESNNDPFHILAYGSEKDCREYVTALGKRLGASA